MATHLDEQLTDQPTDQVGTGPLAELGGAPILGSIGPNWFASVMGTGIVAVAAASLPFSLSGALALSTVCWVLSTVLLVVVTGATIGHRLHHPGVARGHLDDPTMAHFYGAPAMALMTVGAATWLTGSRVIGTTAALHVDLVLWSLGTLLGLATAVGVPYRAMTTHRIADDAAFGGWLMPVVPPMVSAATGAALVPHLPAGQPRETLLLACYAMVGMALLASLAIIPLIWGRLMRHGTGPAALVPTLWIVLGPLGQSVTAVGHLGPVATTVVPAPYGVVFGALPLVYGVPVWGFAMLWLALACALTLRTVRAEGGLPFSLTWWSFTFPVGTVVTGTAALAEITGLRVLDLATLLLFLGLLGSWGVVFVRTARGVWSGRLLRPRVLG